MLYALVILKLPSKLAGGGKEAASEGAASHL